MNGEFLGLLDYVPSFFMTVFLLDGYQFFGYVTPVNERIYLSVM